MRLFRVWRRRDHHVVFVRVPTGDKVVLFISLHEVTSILSNECRCLFSPRGGNFSFHGGCFVLMLSIRLHGLFGIIPQILDWITTRLWHVKSNETRAASAPKRASSSSPLLSNPAPDLESTESLQLVAMAWREDDNLGPEAVSVTWQL